MTTRTSIAVALLSTIAFAAHAADGALPTKAAPLAPAPGYPSKYGFYAGFGTVAEISNASVASAQAGTNLYAAGAAIKAVAGYTFKIGANWGAAEAGVKYTNLGATQTCANTNCSIGASWGFDAGVMVGFPWTQALQLFPAISDFFSGGAPALPSGVTAKSSQPYVGVFGHVDDISGSIGAVRGSAWQATPAVGMGLLNYVDIGNIKGGTIDTRVKYEFADTSLSFGPGGAFKARKGPTTLFEVIFKY